MEWLTAVRGAVAYMEAHLTDEIGVKEVAQSVFVSPFFLQRGFSLMTGFGIGEYLRNRRLYCAALDLKNEGERVIDVALKYGYDTPESFTKAFTRFHGISPSQARSGSAPIRTFLPLSINISVQGGDRMDYRIAPMFPFKLIGFKREFSYDTAFSEIPRFWDELCEKYAYNVYAGNAPANAYEKALVDNCIGEFGVCIDGTDGNTFTYLVAGKYSGGEVPEGMMLYEFPRGDWAVFDCVGPVPEALQSLSARIFKEWLPGNPDYEICGNATVEWYDCLRGEKTDPDYHSAVWVPVIKRTEAQKRWGGTAAYEEYEKRGDKTAAAAKGLMNIFREFGNIKELSPDSPEAKETAAKLKAYITEHYYTCADEILLGLGRLYACDERMKGNIDAAGGEGTAEFASRAIEAYLKDPR
ncbi:MAG: TipAS antibiotic-recognition domain-containing protein [Clostridia bacterium]|nr:TipAS antibiotic-recognition domain-containing protein [Clostridia bacterium]